VQRFSRNHAAEYWFGYVVLLEIFLMSADLVIVDWSDLVGATSGITCNSANSKSFDAQTKINNANNTNIRMMESLKEAYGSHGTGILCIRGMPGFVQAKEAFLPMAHTLATKLPSDYLETHLTDAASLYNAGWSHGKEKLGDDKSPDTAKASFYYNPVSDTPGSESDRRDYPLSYPCNVWPDEAMIPGFRERAVSLGNLLKDACVAVAYHLDAYAARQQPSYPHNLITSSIKDTDKVKARLLYYFPLPPPPPEAPNEPDGDADAAEDSWVSLYFEMHGSSQPSHALRFGCNPPPHGWLGACLVADWVAQRQWLLDCLGR
jgi:hypothetical protein